MKIHIPTKDEPHFENIDEIPYELRSEFGDEIFGDPFKTRRYYIVHQWETSAAVYRRIYTCVKYIKLIDVKTPQEYFTQKFIKIYHSGGPFDGQITNNELYLLTNYWKRGLTYTRRPGYFLSRVSMDLESLGGAKRIKYVAVYQGLGVRIRHQ